MDEIKVRLESVDLTPEEIGNLIGAVQRTVQQYFTERSRELPSAVILVPSSDGVAVFPAKEQ